MFNKVRIKNYKSILDLNMNLGEFTVLIGANGCGKSNILEAITMAAAASAQKLDFEYFANRGMRVVRPELMLPAFEAAKADHINVQLSKEDGNGFEFEIYHDSNAKSPRWTQKSNITITPSFITESDLRGRLSKDDLNSIIMEAISSMGKVTLPDDEVMRITQGVVFEYGKNDLNNFLIYSLEESALRSADKDNRIFPLGRNGEGLFAYLKTLIQREDGEQILNEIKENLHVLDWFEDMYIPSNQLSNEFLINLKDYYMSESINDLNQKSTNEGFLYLLFYLTLIISDQTPAFFAIENIDTAFNPKMCREVIKHLISLAKKHNKQIIATTHNPAVLDGMNLYDNDVVLNVVRRTIDGDTRVSKVKPKPELSIPLSEAWMKGYIGGLPDNF